MSREKILQHLKETNLTPTQLSYLCDFNRETLRNYLAGKKISGRVAWKLYKYFKGAIPMEEFDTSGRLGPYVKKRLKNLAFKANTIPK